MERQRSFSFKPTRLLVFSFTIFSSIFFLSTFTIWLLKSTPSVHQQIRLHFNTSSSSSSSSYSSSSSVGDSVNVGPRSLTVQSLTSFTKNFTVSGVKIPTSIDNRFFRTKNTFLGSKSEDVRHHADASTVNFMAMQDNGTSPRRRFSNEQKKVLVADLVGKTTQVPVLSKIENKTVKGCDLTKGYWVFDENYPLYAKDSCPFIDEGFNCEGNGRLDRKYSKWRWQPKYCDLPRFNATKMLELIRGKRLVFVGDSINRNQWESMLCMLLGAIRDPKRVYETHGRKITKEKGNYSFRFLDYQCTVEYYVSHFLVHETKARIGQKRRPTLRIDAIDRSSSRWRGADILVFNTAHWWSHYKTKAGIYYYQEGSLVHPRLNVSTALRKALMTWASWVDKHMNPRKAQVFFRSSAPSHFRGGNWNSGGHCKEATNPLNETLGTIYPEKNIIIEEIIKQMKTPVTLLNITSLSEYRIDGHPSIYGRKTQSSSFQDCSHWCLPGVPDTWNELLYFHLQSR
ncbi:protein trichome birefringence-like 6 [Gastrolobium bilobum]|uniref:protein trichome birefringence-like 6 n=1 Tax=Gastrolobium bilobum TaxID=150636 RepID=UPI002AAF93D9|nr:protein trichome birefringence-like 6 [Gastrolobium bilobum]